MVQTMTTEADLECIWSWDLVSPMPAVIWGYTCAAKVRRERLPASFPIMTRYAVPAWSSVPQTSVRSRQIMLIPRHIRFGDGVEVVAAFRNKTDQDHWVLWTFGVDPANCRTAFDELAPSTSHDWDMMRPLAEGEHGPGSDF